MSSHYVVAVECKKYKNIVLYPEKIIQCSSGDKRKLINWCFDDLLDAIDAYNEIVKLQFHLKCCLIGLGEDLIVNPLRCDDTELTEEAQ